MFWIVIFLLLLLWLGGLVMGVMLNGLLHLLLAVAVIFVLFKVFRRRKTA